MVSDVCHLSCKLFETQKNRGAFVLLAQNDPFTVERTCLFFSQPYTQNQVSKVNIISTGNFKILRKKLSEWAILHEAVNVEILLMWTIFKEFNLPFQLNVTDPYLALLNKHYALIHGNKVYGSYISVGSGVLPQKTSTYHKYSVINGAVMMM